MIMEPCVTALNLVPRTRAVLGANKKDRGVWERNWPDTRTEVSEEGLPNTKNRDARRKF